MKKSKLSRIAALLAAGALLVGGMFMSCSSGGDDDDGGSSSGTEETGGTGTTAVSSVSVTPSTGKLAVGSETYASVILTASVLPATASDTSVTWTLSDGYESYVTLSGNLTDSSITLTVRSDASITEKQTITATATANGDSSKTASAKIKVYASETDLQNDYDVYLSSSSESTKTGYGTIAAALAAIPSEATSSDTYTITVGTDYAETETGLSYTNSNGATLIIEGDTETEYGADVVIAGKGSSQKNSTSRCFLYIGGNANVILKNLTLKNTIVRSEVTDKDDRGNALTQAEALGFGSSGNLIAYNCSFISHQDTLRTVGKAWFYKCYIAGDVDFIWMESSGVVGLYEECKIEILNDDNASAAYVLAPRATKGTSIAKGNVIYNSTITVPSGLNSYLFRNPWGTNTDYYNQGAVINTTINGTLNSSLANNAAMGTDDQQFIGWKVDSDIAAAYPSMLSSIGVVSTRYEAREYNGRYAILNRLYNTSTQKFENASTLWNPAEELKATDSSITITEDNSENNIFLDYADSSAYSIANGSIELEVTNYKDSVSSPTYSSTIYTTYDADTETFSNEASEKTVTISGNTVSTESTGNFYVKVTATSNNASDWIAVYHVTATGISLDATEATIAIGSSKTLTASFEPEGASAEVVWSSNNTNVTVVDGVVKVGTGASAGDTATITATIKDTELSATCTVTVAEAAILYKYGTSVADLTSYDKYSQFGKDEYLVYPVAINPANDKASIETEIVYSASANIGAGFVAFRDGAYSDGTVSKVAFATPAGIKSSKGGQGYDDGTYPNAAGTYTMKAWVAADSKLYFSLTSGTTTMTKSYDYTYYVPDGNDYIYLALGGMSAAGSASVNAGNITITVGDEEKTVAAFADLTEDTRNELTVSDSLTTAYEMTSTAFNTKKGKSDTITLSNVDLPTSKPTNNNSEVEGKWTWDATTVDFDGSTNPTTTASYIPTDRTTYQAVLSKTVQLTITDSRTEASSSEGALYWVKDWKTNSTVSLAVDATDSNNIATGSDLAVYHASETTALASSSFTVGTQRNQTGLAYTPSSENFSSGDTAMTYKFSVTAGSSKIKLNTFSYAWGCNKTNNFSGTVTVVDSDNNTLYTGTALQSGKTENQTSNGIVASDTISTDDKEVTLAANSSATVIVTVKAINSISNNTNPYVLANAELDFEVSN